MNDQTCAAFNYAIAKCRRHHGELTHFQACSVGHRFTGWSFIYNPTARPSQGVNPKTFKLYYDGQVVGILTKTNLYFSGFSELACEEMFVNWCRSDEFHARPGATGNMPRTQPDESRATIFLRCSPELRDSIKKAAALKRVSVNRFCVESLAAMLRTHI